MKFSQIKHKIKNLGNFKSVKEIKEAGLRIVYNKKDDSYWLIEEEFLKPVIKSPRECKSILIKKEDLKYKVFMCHKSKEELKGTKALDYIKWGEKQGYHKRPTCASRERWWDLEVKGANVIMLRATSDRPFFYISNTEILHDQTFYSIHLKKSYELNILDILLNNIITNNLCREIESGAFFGLGLGALWTAVYEVKNFFTLHPSLINKKVRIKSDRRTNSIFAELGFDPTKPIREQEPNPLPDRKALDDIVFDALGLTEQERKEVYWAVAELVKNRLDKARSVGR